MQRFRRSLPWQLAFCAMAIGLLGSTSYARDHGRVAPPEENRFTRKVLVTGLDEPMEMEFDLHGRVYLIEKPTGMVKRLDEATGKVSLLGTIPVYNAMLHAGLLGFLLDRNFETNRRIYFYYAAPGEVREMHLSRITLGRDDKLDMGSEIVVLRWPIEAVQQLGGGMTWDTQGNLYVTTGDNSSGSEFGRVRMSETAPLGDDAERSAGNTNDLRGKILRIHPEPDGRYTIPAGNLFRPGTPKTRPEIYVMGERNPWRVSVDSRTGYLHWGGPGPDATRDSAGVGPMGYDELNVARAAGNYGWPYFTGQNQAYHRYDVATRSYAEAYDPAHPVNLSPNNTGLRDLPPAQPALLAYPYAVSEKFPALGSGSRVAEGGPVFHRADFKPGAPHLFPAYYEGKWMVSDHMRSWIVALTLNGQSTDVLSAERFLPDLPLALPIDMDFGPDGGLYVLEYGKAPGGELIKIEYNGGNRAPEVEVTSNVKGGALPFKATLSAAGTKDPDRDALRYEWRVVPAAGGAARTFTTASPTVTFDRPGVYNATLTVKDPSGASASKSLRIVAGNEAPAVVVEITGGNHSFYFPGKPLQYAVRVTDREDGAVAPDRVAVSADYVPESFDLARIAQGDHPVDASTRSAVPRAIMAAHDCNSCHQLDTRLVGPGFREVAAKYQGDTAAVGRLVQKVRAGGSGVWGAVAMPPHPSLSVAEATALVRYVLASNSTPGAFSTLPLTGSAPVDVPDAATARGRVVVRAAYTDRGSAGLPAQTAEGTLLLRTPIVSAGSAEVIHGATTRYNKGNGLTSVVPNANGYIAFKQLDLTGVKQIEPAAQATGREGNTGGTIEAHLDSPTGPLLGQMDVSIAVRTAAPPAGGAPAAPAAPAGPRNIPLNGATGVHDLYLIFKNDRARPIDPLFTLSTLKFTPG